MNIALCILFSILSNTEINFANCEFNWKLFTNTKILSIIKWVKLIGKKEFAFAILSFNERIFVVYIAVLIWT